MAQSGPGKIRLFEDFITAQDLVVATAVPRYLTPAGSGWLRVVGQGSEQNDSGAPTVSGALGGAVRLTTTDDDVHSYILETLPIFDVALMGPLVAEARVQFNNFDTKAAFMGFTDIAIGSDVPDIQTDLLTAASATTITPVASDYVGFYLDAELTEDERWHGVYNGGATTGQTVSASCELGTDSVAAKWDIIRLEVDPNGDARWFLNGDLKQSVAAAVSTTVDLKFMIGVGTKGDAKEEFDVAYILVTANRDWTV